MSGISEERVSGYRVPGFRESERTTGNTCGSMRGIRRPQGNKLGCWRKAAETEQGNTCVSYRCTLGTQGY